MWSDFSLRAAGLCNWALGKRGTTHDGVFDLSSLPSKLLEGRSEIDYREGVRMCQEFRESGVIPLANTSIPCEFPLRVATFIDKASRHL